MRFLFILLLFPFCVFAQPKPVAKRGVDVDKKGLVTVNGKKAFYMISKSVVPWESDYAVENLGHEQIAYFKLAKGYRYANNIKSHQEVQYYVLSFNSGAHCEIRDYLKNSKSIIKSLAMILVNSGLICDGKINDAGIEKFVTARNGFMTADKGDTTKPAFGNSAVPHKDGDPLNGVISMKDVVIYYDQQIIGTYNKTDIDTDFVLIQVYSVNKNKVAEVTRENTEQYWRIITVVDQKKETLLYNKKEPLPELFRYLLKKSYL